MEEIRDRAILRLDGYLKIAYGTGLEEKALNTMELTKAMVTSIPEIAIVDRKAELPICPDIIRDMEESGPTIKRFLHTRMGGYKQAQQDMVKQGWIKEVPKC